MIVVGGAILVVAAAMQFFERGADLTGGLAIADYRAAAVPEGGPAPQVQLPSVVEGGGEVSLEDLRGKTVVLNFWASWCTPCWKEAPGLQRVADRYRSQGVRFMGVNERDDIYAARSFIEQNGLRFPSGFDPDGRLAYGYGITGMPTTFVIDDSGALRFRFVGYVEEEALSRALDEVLGQGA